MGLARNFGDLRGDLPRGAALGGGRPRVVAEAVRPTFAGVRLRPCRNLLKSVVIGSHTNRLGGRKNPENASLDSLLSNCKSDDFFIDLLVFSS